MANKVIFEFDQVTNRANSTISQFEGEIENAFKELNEKMRRFIGTNPEEQLWVSDYAQSFIDTLPQIQKRLMDVIRDTNTNLNNFVKKEEQQMRDLNNRKTSLG